MSALTAVRSLSFANSNVLTELGKLDTSTALTLAMSVDCDTIVQFGPNVVVVLPRVSVPEIIFQFSSKMNSFVVTSPRLPSSFLSVRLPFSMYTFSPFNVLSTVWWKPVDHWSSYVLPKWFQSAS